MKKIIYILASVIGIVLIIIVVKQFSKKAPLAVAPTNNAVVAKAPVFTQATTGTLVNGFPPNILQEKNVVVTTSYSYNNKQYTAVYKSPSNVSDVYQLYLSFANRGQYQIISNKLSATYGALYLHSNDADLNIQITQADKGSNVNITYLNEKAQ